MIGALIGLGAEQLGITDLLHCGDVLVVPAILGAVIALTRARPGLYITAALMLLALLTVGYTPLVAHLMPSLERKDILQPSPAVVVLSASVEKDHSLTDRAQARILQGYKLLRQGYAQHLVLTHATVPFGSEEPAVRAQMQWLGLDYPIEVTGPVDNTHDEALAVAALAHRHGWNRVILVTHPWHMRRAAAVFETAGVPVLCAPCVEGKYDLDWLQSPSDRYDAFSDWLHEAIGYEVYRWRGWIR